MINCLSLDLQKYNKTPNTILGFTLMTMHHEFGHFTQRFDLHKFYQWFEKASPAYEGQQEAGSELMKKIFKKDPTTINKEATEFLFNERNWDCSNDAFASEFNSLNFFSEEGRNLTVQIKED
jgi:hypothetical protein